MPSGLASYGGQAEEPGVPDRRSLGKDGSKDAGQAGPQVEFILPARHSLGVGGSE